MTDVIAPPLETPEPPGISRRSATATMHDHGGHEDHGPTGILKWLTSTDHKVIGLSYMITSIVMFYLAGIMALFIRLQLTSPHSSLLTFAQYNELFTMHGSLMLYLFAGPFAFGGLANFIVPLQIGAPDMAFPRLNALSYWLYLTGSITMLLGFFVAGGAAQLRLGGLRPALERHQFARAPVATCGSWPWPSPASRPSSPASTCAGPSSICAPRA